MGNNISSEREGSSSPESSPTAERWTAARGRASGFGPLNHAKALSPHQLPVSSFPQEPADVYSGPQPGRNMTASADKENARPMSRDTLIPPSKRRKTHAGLADCSGQSGLVGATPHGVAALAPAVIKGQAPVPDGSSLPESERTVSRSVAIMPRPGGGGGLGVKRKGLACMTCLQHMGSSGSKKRSFACRNQPGQGRDTPCQLCRDIAQDCRQRE